MNEEINNDRQTTITGDRVLRVLKKNLVVILAVALLCFGAAYAYMSLAVAPVYLAGAKFYIESSTGNKNSSGDITSTRLLAETFIEILDTNTFFKTVRNNLPDDLKEKYSSEQLLKSSSFSIQNNTEVVLVVFSSTDKDTVIPVINAVLSSMQAHLDVAYGECSCHIVDTPEAPSISSGKTNTTAVIALLFGAALTFILFLFRDLMDVRVRGAEDISRRYGIAILGTVPSFGDKVRKKEGADSEKSR